MRTKQYHDCGADASQWNAAITVAIKLCAFPTMT